MKTMSYRAGLVIAILALVLTSGCIDVFAARDALIQDDETRIVYEKVVKLQVEEEFSTTPALGSARHEDRESIYIKGNTRWLQLDIWVQIRAVDIPEALEELLQDRPRFLELTLENPLGGQMFHARYNTSTEEKALVFNNPLPGIWQVHYTAQGIGHDSIDYHDSFSIVARAYEPT